MGEAVYEITPMAIEPDHAYVVGGDSYAALEEALAAVPSGGGTIALQKDANPIVTNTIMIDKNITFDLTNGNLSIFKSSGLALDVKNCTVSLTGSGCLDVTGGVGIHADNATVTVRNVTGNQGDGAYAFNGGKIIVLGDAKGYGAGAFAYGNGSTITVAGDALSTGNNEMAVLAENEGSVEVAGNATATGMGSTGAKAKSVGTVKITGDATGSAYGVYAITYSKITVGGNVAATGSGAATGAFATDNSTVTTDGSLSGSIFAEVGGMRKGASEKTTPTTKMGYDTYTNDNVSFVWVKDAGSATTQLATPTNLRWDTSTPGSIKAKWDAVTGADYYKVRIFKEGHPTMLIQYDRVMATEQDFYANLGVIKTNGTGKYSFQVQALPADDNPNHTAGAWTAESAEYPYTAVCMIGIGTYPGLDWAIDAITGSSATTITLLQDITHTKAVVISKSITLDLGNKNLTIDTSGNPYEVANFTALTVNNNCTVTVTGTGTLNVKGIARGVWAVDGASVTVDNAESTSQNGSLVSAAAHAEKGGKITVKGDAKGYLMGAAATGTAGSNVTVNGK